MEDTEMNTFPNILIFSVYQGQNPGTDHNNTGRVRRELTNLGIEYKNVEGSFQGKTEEAFIVDARHEKYVVDFCKEYNQQAYLFSHNDRYTELVSVKTGERAGIGHLTSQTNKPKNEDYTFDAQLGLYWVAR